MLATVTSKGQVTIPKEIRDLLNIRTNDKIDFVLEGDRVVLVPVKTLLDLRGVVGSGEKGDFSDERARTKNAVAGETCRGKRLVETLRGRATVKMTTDEIMAFTRETAVWGRR